MDVLIQNRNVGVWTIWMWVKITSMVEDKVAQLIVLMTGGKRIPKLWSIIVQDAFSSDVGCLHSLDIWVHHDVEE